MPYSDCKVLGPYKRPDGRQHMIVTFPDGAKSTISYPKYHIECKLGRLLEFNEIVHHIDEDPTNDSPDNFEVKDRVSHGKGHHSKYTDGDVDCFSCAEPVWLTAKQQSNLGRERNRGKRGPFCKKCRPVNQYV